MRIGMVWAEASGGAIGRDGVMPWHLPEDLAHFREVTRGAPVIMGRRTWESLPERFRPLPGRRNLVVSRDPEFTAAGAEVCGSLDAAIARAGATDNVETVWIMGGGQIYRAAMPLADELVVTRIDAEVPDADAFAPTIDEEWELAERGEQLVSKNGLPYRFERYRR